MSEWLKQEREKEKEKKKRGIISMHSFFCLFVLHLQDSTALKIGTPFLSLDVYLSNTGEGNKWTAKLKEWTVINCIKGFFFFFTDWQTHTLLFYSILTLEQNASSPSSFTQRLLSFRSKLLSSSSLCPSSLDRICLKLIGFYVFLPVTACTGKITKRREITLNLEIRISSSSSSPWTSPPSFPSSLVSLLTFYLKCSLTNLMNKCMWKFLSKEKNPSHRLPWLTC